MGVALAVRAADRPAAPGAVASSRASAAPRCSAARCARCAASSARGPQLNLWVRTAPRGTDEFHWHLDLLPRLTIRAGFELGTGVDINTYPPERAAADLREALG